MKSISRASMAELLLSVAFCLSLSFSAKAQAPSPALVGYFHNWQDAQAPYVQLDQVDSRYNVIDIAFALPQAGTDYQMTFTPAMVSSATFINQIQTLHNQGRKVLISVGGATAPVSLSNTMERDSFISTMNRIISTYHFDGMDIDFEGSSLSVSGGTISNPVDAPIINLIYAAKQIMSNFYIVNGHRMILTMAPETAYVQGGMSAYSGLWGAYLPVIHALRDSLEILHVQLYNSGSMYGIDGGIYTQGTADFILAETEAVIHGFNTAGGYFTGLPASKVAVGLPACSNAAGGGYVAPTTVKAAIDYLRGTGPRPGTYTLAQTGGYPTLRGMMTWSINWDAVATCSASYAYAANYQTIFGSTPSCSVPSSLSSIPSSASAALSWSNTGAVSYNLQYKLAASSTWTSVSTSTNTYNVTGLTNCTAYNYQVQSVCSATTSAYSSAANFTTTGCSVTYCTSAGTNTSREYINKIALGSINNTSGNNSGYGNFTNQSTTLTGNTTVTIAMTPGFSGKERKEYWTVYIDYNHNGSFADAGEKVASGNSISTLTKSFTVPTTALNGTTRMRIQMKNPSAAANSCTVFTYGEVEDYTVNIIGNAARNESASTSIDLNTNQVSLKFYPNPAGESIFIDAEGFSDEMVVITVMNLLGEKMQEVVVQGKELRQYSLNLQNILSGMYELILQSDTGKCSAKMIKM